MNYTELAPHPTLAPYVACYWLLSDGGAPAEAESPAREIIYPDGCAELIFHRGGRFAVGRDDRFERQPQALVFGQLERRIELRRPPCIETVGVRFHPAGMAALLQVDAASLTARWQPLADVGGRWAAGLERRVQEADSATAAVRAIDRVLTARVARGLVCDELVEGAVGQIERAAGHLSIAELARHAGISTRQLERRFRRHVGLSPKRLASIRRLQAAFALLAADTPPLIEVAHRCGYYDQAHFIRDFRRVTGLPPGRFLRDDGAMARLFVSG